MLAALQAAQAAGGDIRGQQSACMLVADGIKSDKPWEHLLVDVRVDDSARSPWVSWNVCSISSVLTT